MIIGLAGVILFLAAWVLEMQRAARQKSSGRLDVRLHIIYILAGLLITYYASQTANYAFILLGAVISFLTLAEIVYLYIKNQGK
jgi:hypothetical protein